MSDQEAQLIEIERFWISKAEEDGDFLAKYTFEDEHGGERFTCSLAKEARLAIGDCMVISRRKGGLGEEK